MRDQRHTEDLVAKHEASSGHVGGRPRGDRGSKHRPYLALLVSLAVSYPVMYAIMYSMVDRWSNVYLNVSNAYMAGLMAGSMLPVMLLTMRGMFKNRRANAALWAVSAVVLALFWFLLRAEAGVGDRQFMRAMIPHHAAAIQMARESGLSDPRVKNLAEEIILSQEREIAEMKVLLAGRQPVGSP